MTEQISKVWVCGIYNWQAGTSKEERMKGEYSRHNWCDIDVVSIENLDAVLQVFKKWQVDCISQRCGKGFHVFGDLVEYPLWQLIWDEIRPYADQKWAPHTMRISKKRKNEVWERPIYHKNKNEPQNWAKALMSFLCKELRSENSTNLWNAMHQCGLDKYFHCVVYEVELKQ